MPSQDAVEQGSTMLQYLGVGAQIATIVTVGSLIFLAIQVKLQINERRREDQRLEQERQETAYKAITDQYTHLLELCLDRPWLTFPWLNAGRLRERPKGELTPEQWLQDLLVYELLFETIEKAFVLYRAQSLYEDPAQPGRFTMATRPSDAEVAAGDFRGRQWWGWDSWVGHFSREPLFWERWEMVQDEDTYDGWFMQYMRAKEQELHIDIVGRDDEDFWERMEALLTESFDPDALRPAQQIRALAPRDPANTLLDGPRFVGAYQGGRLVGFVIVEYLAPCRALYLWYLAVASDVRSQGLGARLVAWLDEQLDDLAGHVDPPPLGIIAEVEAPGPNADLADDDLRRIRFYERHGYTVLPIEEASPPFAPGASEAVMYWLMMKPRRGVDPATLTSDQVVAFLAGSYSGSTLNGPSPDAEPALDFARSTWGRPPRDAAAMQRAWESFVSRP